MTYHKSHSNALLIYLCSASQLAKLPKKFLFVLLCNPAPRVDHLHQQILLHFVKRCKNLYATFPCKLQRILHQVY